MVRRAWRVVVGLRWWCCCAPIVKVPPGVSNTMPESPVTWFERSDSSWALDRRRNLLSVRRAAQLAALPQPGCRIHADRYEAGLRPELDDRCGLGGRAERARSDTK